MKISEIITLALAIWGAVLSTALGVWTIVRDAREDGRLRIRVWVGKMTSHDAIEPYCSFDVVNVGRRPAYFGGLILHDRDGKYLAQPLGPVEEDTYERLEPGEIRGSDPSDEFRDMQLLARTRRIYAIDTRRGRTYLARWRVWQMHRQVRKIQAEHRALVAKRAAERGTPEGEAEGAKAEDGKEAVIRMARQSQTAFNARQWRTTFIGLAGGVAALLLRAIGEYYDLDLLNWLALVTMITSVSIIGLVVLRGFLWFIRCGL